MTEDYTNIKICSVCYKLYGVGFQNSRKFDQKCACQPRDTKWEGFDFNEAVTLCHCCGKEVLKSGSKWSVWFCGECRGKIGEINSRFQQTPLPIGRHSIMSGVMLKGEDRQNHEKIELFLKDFKSLSDRITVVEKWRTEIVKRNFKALGLTEDILLSEYLSNRDRLASKDEALKGLVDFLVEEEQKKYEVKVKIIRN